MSTSKLRPRFVPTLTEVVDPTSLSLTSATKTADVDQVARIVMKQLNAMMSDMLHSEMNKLTAEFAIRFNDIQSSILEEVVQAIPNVVQNVLNTHTPKEHDGSTTTSFD